MRSLIHSLNRSRGTAAPLPDRFRSVALAGIRVRRGQMTMVAGQPGSCKSLYALDYAVHAGVPTLYFSADSDDSTVVARVGAMRLGMSVDDVEQVLESDNRQLVEAELADLGDVRFVFDPTPTLDVIADEILAFNEIHGMPSLIIIDNLINVVCETTDNEWQGLRHLMASMHQMARETNAAVLILHHTSEGEGKPTEPQARKALMGKVAQLPEVILTCALDPAAGLFRLAAVKNRSGKADASGGSYVTLSVDLPRMRLSEQAHGTSQAVSNYWNEVR